MDRTWTIIIIFHVIEENRKIKLNKQLRQTLIHASNIQRVLASDSRTHSKNTFDKSGFVMTVQINAVLPYLSTCLHSVTGTVVSGQCGLEFLSFFLFLCRLDLRYRILIFDSIIRSSHFPFCSYFFLCFPIFLLTIFKQVF